MNNLAVYLLEFCLIPLVWERQSNSFASQKTTAKMCCYCRCTCLGVCFAVVYCLWVRQLLQCCSNCALCCFGPTLSTPSPSPSLPEMSMLAVPRIQLPDAHVSMRTMYEEADRIALKYIQDGTCVRACVHAYVCARVCVCVRVFVSVCCPCMCVHV